MGCRNEPDYGSAARDQINAEMATVGPRKQLDRLARLGEKGTVEGKEYDFRGIGDIDLSRANLDFWMEAADKFAAGSLETAEKYGVDVVKQRRREMAAADPEGFRMRQELGRQISEGGPEKYFTQAAEGAVRGARGSQAARGNLFGNAPSIQEAMAVGDVGFRMYQQDIANKAAFGAGVSPVAQFSQLSGAQQGASAFQGQNIMNSGVGVMNNNQFAQGTGNIYNQQMRMAQEGGPLSQIAGMGAGLGLTALTGGIAGMAGGQSFGKGVSGIFGLNA